MPLLFFFSSFSSSFLLLFPFPLSGCCFSWISSLNHFDGQRIYATYMKFMRLICKAATWDSLRSGLQEPGTCGFDCLCSHSWEFALPFCRCMAPLAEWPVSLERPLLFLLLSPGKHPTVHQLGPEVFIDIPWGSSKSWKERGVGLSQKSFGRLWPRRASASPTLELSGCFSRGKEGAEQGSLEGVYAGGVTRSSSCCGVMFWVEQHFCICVLWFPHSAMAWRGKARLFTFALCHFQNTFLTNKY